MAYCDTGEDLKNVLSDIADYEEREVLPKLWTLTSGQTNTYQQSGLGTIKMVYDDNVPLTLKTSIATVEAAAGSWWYDSTNNILYVHAINSDNLTTATITLESGLDWETFKTNMRNKAQEIVDSYLNRMFPTPLMPRLIKTHVTASDYEYPIVMITAIITCALIVQRRNPDDPVAKALWRKVLNQGPEVGEQKGFINQILDGDMVLQEQISVREVGNFNVYPKSNNTATAYVWVLGKYEGSYYGRWRLQIDTAGAPGVATYKLSYDTGTNWDKTLQETFKPENDDRRIYIGSGIYVVFYGTFGEDDYWDIEVFPQTDSATISKFGSIQLSR